MRLRCLLTALTTLISSFVYCQTPVLSSKRGLVYVPSEKHPQDDANWESTHSDLTWYYNYAAKPSLAFANFPKLQFVPMLWGSSNSSTFLSDVLSQIKAGAKVNHVLGFNEPDGDSNTYVPKKGVFLSKTEDRSQYISDSLGTFQLPKKTLILMYAISGGSDIPAETAAQIWMQQIEPLAKQGVKLGAPACTGAEKGRQWTQDFLKACVNCTIDFIPVHVCDPPAF